MLANAFIADLFGGGAVSWVTPRVNTHIVLFRKTGSLGDILSAQRLSEIASDRVVGNFVGKIVAGGLKTRRGRQYSC